MFELFDKNLLIKQGRHSINFIKSEGILIKIIFDATVMEHNATGIAKTVFYLYEASVSLMPSIQVIALHRQKLRCILPPKVQTIQNEIYIPARFWRFLYLPIYIYNQKPAIAHFPWNGNVPKLCPETTVITTIHDVLPLSIPNYFKSKKDELLYRKRIQTDIDRTHLLITDSNYSKNEIMKNFIVKNEPLVLYPGPTIEKCQFVRETLDTEHENYFIYVGGYDQRKGIENLLKIFIKLHKKKLISSKLILTGEKKYYSNSFKQIIDEGCSLGIVKELGYVSDATLFNLLSNSKALVYPSKYEGFGLPPLEAMTLGCPVITTKYTSIPEVCGDAAYYIEPDNEENFAKALIDIENDARLCNELKIKGHRQATKFSWNRSAELFLSSLTEMYQKHTLKK